MASLNLCMALMNAGPSLLLGARALRNASPIVSVTLLNGFGVVGLESDPSVEGGKGESRLG